MRLLTAMGFADVVGPFVGLTKNEFRLRNLAASLIPFVAFSLFGLLSPRWDCLTPLPALLYITWTAALSFKCAGA